MMENRKYPRHLFRLAAVNARDTAMTNRAGNPNSIRYILDSMLYGIGGCPRHL